MASMHSFGHTRQVGLSGKVDYLVTPPLSKGRRTTV